MPNQSNNFELDEELKEMGSNNLDFDSGHRRHEPTEIDSLKGNYISSSNVAMINYLLEVAEEIIDEICKYAPIIPLDIRCFCKGLLKASGGDSFLR